MVKKVDIGSITTVSPQIWSAPTVVTSNASAAGVRLSADKTKPTVPTNVTAVATSPTTVAMTWDASTDPVVPGQTTSGMKGYRVFRNSQRIAETDKSVRAYTDTGRTPGTSYQYRVAAVDKKNNQSGQSPQITVHMPEAEPVPDEPDTTAPSVPTGLLATTQGETAITLTWAASSETVVSGQEESGLAGYKVYRDTVLIATLGLVTTYPDTGLTAGTEYSYRVSAIDVDGNESAQSAASVATTTSVGLNPDVTPPSVPTGLAALAQGSSSISLTWVAATDPVIGGEETSGLLGYRLRRGGSVIATVGLVTTYLDSGLSAATAYSYTIASVDAAGNESAQSAAQQATTSASSGGGATIVAASAQRADVLAAIALAVPGDAVVVPAGTASWSGGVLISGITLRGPGKAAGAPTNITAGTVTITKHATHVTRYMGFRHTGNVQHFAIGGALSARAFVVDDCYFANSGAVMGRLTTNGGLFSDCTFVAAPPHGQDVFQIALAAPGGAGLESWAAAPTMGTADTTGETNTYFEDCTWSGFLEVSLDVDNGARAVVRHCALTDSSFVCHGGGSGSSGNDSSSYGNKHFEVYDNTFDRVSNAVPINKWCWWRGGGGVFVDNVVDEASSPDGSSYPNKPELRLTVSCPGAYPLAYQVGQVVQVPENPPSKPLLIYGNTGAGASSGNFIAIGENPFGGCGSPGNYIQEGRDYKTSNTWGWTKYPYPHPLRP